jgi:hypothetical protein
MVENNNDITGLEFTVSANYSGSEGGMKILVDEWLPALLVKFEKFQNANPTWGEQLRWYYELQGQEYTWKAQDGRVGQFRVTENTSLACSPKSKLYQRYSKLVGKEPTEGEKISLKTLINFPCFVMVKATKGKNKQGVEQDYYNVVNIKPRIVEKQQLQPQQSVTPPKVTTQSQSIQQPDPKLIKEVAKGETSTDIFGDIF